MPEDLIHLVCFNCFTPRDVELGYIERLEDTHRSKTGMISTVVHCDKCGYHTFHMNLEEAV